MVRWINGRADKGFTVHAVNATCLVESDSDELHSDRVHGIFEGGIHNEGNWMYVLRNMYWKYIDKDEDEK